MVIDSPGTGATTNPTPRHAATAAGVDGVEPVPHVPESPLSPSLVPARGDAGGEFGHGRYGSAALAVAATFAVLLVVRRVWEARTSSSETR